MAGGIPVTYRGSSGIYANYNFSDIAAGTGIISYYGARDKDANGVLTTSTIYSDKVSTAATMSSAWMPKAIDMDFDVVINVPTTIAGICTLSVPLCMSGNNDGNYYGYIYAKLRKVSTGGVESDIVSLSGAMIHRVRASAVYTTDHEGISMIQMSVPTTQFMKGETLRMTIEAYGYSDASGSPYIFIGHDPQNRTEDTGISPRLETGYTSKMVVNIPVRIDL